MSLITDVLVCLNDQRREAGLAPLTSNSLLMQTARQHAEFMNAAQVLSHGGENRSTFEERIRATGYRFTAAAENVAKGAVNADGVPPMDGQPAEPRQYP
ncbi:CAP domain-containing protein [Sneathiella sp.]|uniref:CAP domain-containing protein n=1 Tax=Sneathiella sp. TaxID=1964365 RepID=UPI0035624522